MGESLEEPPDNKNLFKTGRVLLEPKKKFSSLLIAKNLEIKTKINQEGFQICLGRKNFGIIYPENIWQIYPDSLKKSLSEILTFALTLHLPYLFEIDRLIYRMPKVKAKNLILEGFIKSLPATALMKSEKTSKLLEKFSKINYLFEKGENQGFDPISIEQENEAVLAFSFGKDSLLTFSVCKEIGLKTIPVYMEEPITYFENRHKRILAKNFFKEFNQKIIFLKNEAGILREAGKNGWYGWELQLTHLGLFSLPVAFAKRAKYFFFANEQSCNDKFLDSEGYWCNPVYEQSIEWVLKFRKIVKSIGIKNLFVGSLVEPIHEIAIIKILHKRYPEIAKYQMSCGEVEVENEKSRWCGNCSKCARIFIFLLANGIDPKKVNFPHDMLKLKFKNKFSLFNGKNGNYGYDKAGLGRDEQLLAFLLAYRNGAKGDLIEFFKKFYLKEAEKREKELREKYFGIHSTTTIPKELKEKVLNIYREGLKDLK